MYVVLGSEYSGHHTSLRLMFLSIFTEFTDKISVAQAALFFAAGFETSSTTISFILHELSLQPVLQEKLRAEIKTAFEENDGKVTYDMVSN